MVSSLNFGVTPSRRNQVLTSSGKKIIGPAGLNVRKPSEERLFKLITACSRSAWEGVVVVGVESSVVSNVSELALGKGSKEICGFLLEPVEIRVKLKATANKEARVIRMPRHRIFGEEDHRCPWRFNTRLTVVLELDQKESEQFQNVRFNPS